MKHTISIAKNTEGGCDLWVNGVDVWIRSSRGPRDQIDILGHARIGLPNVGPVITKDYFALCLLAELLGVSSDANDPEFQRAVGLFYATRRAA